MKGQKDYRRGQHQHAPPLGGTENWVHISQVAGVVEGTNPLMGQMVDPVRPLR